MTFGVQRRLIYPNWGIMGPIGPQIWGLMGTNRTQIWGLMGTNRPQIWDLIIPNFGV